MSDLKSLRKIDAYAREGRAFDEHVVEMLADVAAAVGVEGAALVFCEDDELVAKAAYGALRARPGERFPIARTPASAAIERDELIVLEDVARHDPPLIPSSFAVRAGAGSLMGAPLMSQTGVLGVLFVGAGAPRAFDDRQRMLVQLFGDRLASALETARAFEAERRARVDADAMQRRFHAVFEAALDGLVLNDDELRIVDLNPAACRLLGRSREELVGTKGATLLPPSKQEQSADRIGEFMAAGVLRRESAMVMPDGTMRRAEYGAVANVAPGLHLSILRDVEDRRRLEEARRFLDEATSVLTSSLDYDETLASVARLAVPQIADWATVDWLESGGTFRRVAVAHVDPHKVALAHDVWKRQRPFIDDPTGVGAVVRTGHSEIVEIVTDEMLVAALEHDPELLGIIRELGLVSGMTVPIAVRGRTAGAISFISAESRRRYGASDLAIAEDLARRASHAIENALTVKELRETTAEKDLFLRRTEHLQATAARLVRAQDVVDICRAFASEDCTSGLGAHAGALFTRSGDALSALATTGAWTAAVKRWSVIPLEREVPLTIATRTGEPIWIRDTEDFRTRYPAAPPDSLQSGMVARAAVPLHTPSGCIGVLALAFTESRSFDAEDREYLTAVANLWANALHRARLADSEREALRRVIDAESLATRKKDEFLAMLGHELRNPLAPIITATSLIRARGRASGRELEIIDRQARHLVRLVDDLLDISRVTSGNLPLKRESVDLGDVIEQAMEMTARAFEEKRILLHLETADGPLRTSGDHERLVQVVTNLLVNASKFTPAMRSVYVVARRDGDSARIDVRDEGEGIDAELLPRVFEVFTQGQQSSDRKNGGLGLGLTIARSIVTAHGGAIEARSGGRGTGAVFSVRLPLDGRGERRPTPSLETREVAPPGRRRVLVVDDNVDSAELIAEYLGDMGYDVLVANDAQQALSIACQSVPDAAILDIGLPEVDGYELARAIAKELGARAPRFLALTGYAQERDREKALRSGFVAHFAKPVDMTKLASTLRSILATDGA